MIRSVLRRLPYHDPMPWPMALVRLSSFVYILVCWAVDFYAGNEVGIACYNFVLLTAVLLECHWRRRFAQRIAECEWEIMECNARLYALYRFEEMEQRIRRELGSLGEHDGEQDPVQGNDQGQRTAG